MLNSVLSFSSAFRCLFGHGWLVSIGSHLNSKHTLTGALVLTSLRRRTVEAVASCLSVTWLLSFYLTCGAARYNAKSRRRRGKKQRYFPISLFSPNTNAFSTWLRRALLWESYLARASLHFEARGGAHHQLRKLPPPPSDHEWWRRHVVNNARLD